ncbi:FHA domain-containing protein [Anaerolineae bacterium CFX9]|nr:FHA domain-containing protein [Anaerolineae bacterium CFX9]
MVLKLEIEGYPTPLVITPKNEITLGRRDPATGTMPDIDLTAYSGYRLGVSRTHAIIRMKGDLLELLDLGSSNGTQLNGTRLTPHHPQIIRDGDLITLGKMVIRALFQLITPNPT